MTIVVLVKQVPDMNAVRVDKNSGRVSVSGKAMSSLDAYAMLHALKLRESLGGEIVAVTAGPAAAKDALTRALAMGADRGIHIELDDQAARDSLDMATVFAGALSGLDAAVVLCGQASDDFESGQIGPQLAELMGVSHVSWVMTSAVEGDRLRLQRDTEAGYQEVTVPMPVVVMVQPGTEEPPYPSIKGMMAAKKKPVEKVSAPAAGSARLSWGEPTLPQRETQGVMVQGASAQDAARQLVAWLAENRLIAR